MQRLAQRLLRLSLALICMGIGVNLLLLTAFAQQPQDTQQINQQQWRSQHVSHYRMSIRAEYRGATCFQQFEVRFGEVAQVFQNTCNTAWLNILTVPELFNIAQQIDDIPPTRCYPSAKLCTCQRTFSARSIEYDPVMGFPTQIMSRSDLQPNWAGVDYWQRLMKTSALPSCGPDIRRLTIQVVALTPLS